MLNSPRFLVVCLNPTFQRTITLERLECGEVNRGTATRLDASGKGVNTARVLRQLGASVRHLTHLGPEGNRLLDLCRGDGLDICWEASDSEIRTCTTLLHGDTGETTEIIEPSGAVNGDTAERIQRAFARELGDADRLIIAGTRTPGYPEGLYVDFVRAAADAGVGVLADFHGDELRRSMGEGLAAVKINLVEFTRTFLPGVDASEGEDAEAVKGVKSKMRELSSGGCDIVVTRGGREVLFSRGGEAGVYAPPRVRAVNTIGSGDAFSAGFAFALAKGADIAAAVAEGARCGGMNAALLRPGSIIL